MSKEMDEEEFFTLCYDKAGEAAVCEAVEKHPALVHCRDTRRHRVRCTPLHYAAVNGHQKAARLLLEHNAEVNAQDKRGWTPLHDASRTGHVEVARLLVERGAEVNAQSRVGSSPLFMAAYMGHVEVVRLLLEHGGELSARKSDGVAPLHRCSDAGREEVVWLLLERGAEVNAQDRDGWTPLHYASCYDRRDTARRLIEHGADRSIESSRGETARDVAKRSNSVKTTVLLESYFPISPQLLQLLLGLNGPTESPLTRFARHSAFEPNVLSLVKCLLTGERSPVFEQLQCEVQG